MSEHREPSVVVVERSDSGLGGFLFGLAFGAGLALLLAPNTGEETRRQLKNTGRRFRAAAAEKAEDLQEALSAGFERTRDRVDEELGNVREVFDEKREGAKQAVDAGKAAVRSARSELERRLAKSKSKSAKTAARRSGNRKKADDDE